MIDKNAGSNEENMIWLIPAGQADYFGLPGLRRKIEEFYVDDEIETAQSSRFPGIEIEEFEECILLH